MLTNTVDKEKLSLSISDRCDSMGCAAQAYVAVRGLSGELFFCAHHYEKILSDSAGYEKMMSFMLEVLDNREMLNENRLIGDH